MLRIKNFSARGAALALGLALSACGSTVNVQSTAYSGVQKKESLAVRYDSQMPPTIQLRKAEPGPLGFKPTIDSADQACVSAAANVLNGVLASGFRDRFAALGRNYGVNVSPPAGSPRASQLSIRISQVSGFRSPYGCLARLQLVATLRTEGKAEWSFSAQVGPESLLHKVDQEMFDTFAKELLDKMKSAGVI